MNPNDILAQQQALHDQLLKMAQHDYWSVAWPYVVIGSIQLVALGVIALFCYARLKSISEELRAFRVAYEMVHDRRQPSGSLRKPTPDSPGNPFQESGVSQG